MTQLIGWASAAVLLCTISSQVWHQWRAKRSEGVSPWLFIGQCTASAGLLVYSVLRDDLVFIGLNACMCATAVVGFVLWLRYRAPEGQAAGPPLRQAERLSSSVDRP